MTFRFGSREIGGLNFISGVSRNRFLKLVLQEVARENPSIGQDLKLGDCESFEYDGVTYTVSRASVDDTGKILTVTVAVEDKTRTNGKEYVTIQLNLLKGRMKRRKEPIEQPEN